jgi:hypothetical protein
VKIDVPETAPTLGFRGAPTLGFRGLFNEETLMRIRGEEPSLSRKQASSSQGKFVGNSYLLMSKGMIGF